MSMDERKPAGTTVLCTHLRGIYGGSHLSIQRSSEVTKDVRLSIETKLRSPSLCERADASFSSSRPHVQ